MALFAWLQVALSQLHKDERAQDAFEYLLVIGGISVAVILAMVTPVGKNLINAVVDGVCLAVDTVVTTLDCSTV